ncbi:MAG: hypothetical protein EPO65_07665 [Dehalococcoidia bacterium]|nr:MAG: hypothetical protein EPO65_07665 [Dehalococcoidia bacterium]
MNLAPLLARALGLDSEGRDVKTTTVTVPAAASASVDAGVEVLLRPSIADRERQTVALIGIATRGVLSTDLDITVDADDVQDGVMILPPSLNIDTYIEGSNRGGIKVTIRNRRQVAVPVVLTTRGRVTASTTTLTGAAITTPLSDIGARPNYYDRNASDVSLNWNTGGTGPHAATTRATYTVPAGKKALVESAVVYLQRLVAQSSIGLVSISASVWSAGGSFLYNVAIVTSYTGSGYQAPAAQHQSNIGVLFAGEVLKLISVDYGTDGTVAYDGSVKIVEMDA